MESLTEAFSVTLLLLLAQLVSQLVTRCCSGAGTLSFTAESRADVPRKRKEIFRIPPGNLRAASGCGAIDQLPHARFQPGHLQPAAVGLQVNSW
jgi:hypothetical protein